MNFLEISAKRKAEIKQAVIDCLDISGCNTLPVPIEDIILSIPNVYIKPYSLVAAEHNYTEKEVIRSLNSKDSCLFQFGKNRRIIFYNDMDRSQIANNRYRWNLAHELGHVCLKHCSNDRTRIWRNNLTEKEYDIYEAEADYFAQLILVPHICLYHMHIYSYSKVINICKISKVAGSNRKIDYDKWLENRDDQDEYDLAVLDRYNDYVFKKRCNNCKGIFIQRDANFCIFCGSKKIEWSDKKEMKYPKPITYDNGKLKTCPCCSNEETSYEGHFCQICNSRLINACTNNNCNVLLPSNARYCYLCGSKSIFFQNNYLKDWKIECNAYNAIPDGLDEELPFN